MELSQKQAESIDQATGRSNIWHGSVRSGKTVGSIMKWIEYVPSAPQHIDGHLMMVGKTERTLATNILTPLQNYLGKRNFNFTLGAHKAYMFGIPIELYGASDARAEEKVRGSTGTGVYGDEITLWPKGFYKMLMTRLSVEGAQGFFTTNPDSPYHEIKTEFMDNKGIDLKSFHFKLTDNPFLPKKYVEDLQKEYTGLFYKRFILGEWVLAEGAIFDFFEDKAPMVIPAEDLPEAKWHTASIDYGTQNPFCCGLYGHNPDTTPKVWQIKEYWYDGRKANKQKTDLEYCEDLKEFFGPIKPRKIFVDPSAASFKVQMKRSSFMGINDADNDVVNGIMTHSRMLKSGEFAVSSDCKNSIREYQSYVWDEKAQDKGEDKPKKDNDHSMDQIRYLLHSLFGEDHLDYSKLVTW